MTNATDPSITNKVKKIVSETQDEIDTITDECILEITKKGPSKTSSPLMQSLRILIKFGNRFALLGERTVSELESGPASDKR